MLQAERIAERTASLRHLERDPGGAFSLYLGGRFAAASDGGTRELVDPATGETVGRVAEATRADAERAIAIARAAFDEGSWPETPALERARLLHVLANAIDANAAGLAALETLGCGKPLREAEYDVADAANCFRYYAGLATKPHGQTYDVPAPSQSFTVREPIGVCGQIVPWNYPLLMAVWKLAPALAAGNVCILKPSEFTPLSALWLAKMIAEAGFPDGVLSVLPGAGPVAGAALAESMLVDKIAFTGSVPTGQTIMRAAACNVKKISLELGGKSPNIVFADADFETAIDYALFGIYANAGQVCSAGSRLVVARSIAAKFVAELVRRAGRIVVGDGFDPATEMGPLVSRRQRERVEEYIAIGRAEGATLACGGGRLPGELGERGNYVMPTIFTDTTPQMRIVREEIFGPVLAVQVFDDEADAVRIANDSPYGLAGAVFTSDAALAHRVIRKLRAGITWINAYHPTYNEAPWGGYKQSGIGRELGTYGYDAYTEVKQINVNLAVEPSGWFKD
ncbi:MAG: aldehyde dehydrogenase family protein [Candidatus Eremiobacteraeota bacterium]|nr:aldehyde dehydrogenase family protein [Candidatus Eremiobacteraeota bacterium]